MDTHAVQKVVSRYCQLLDDGSFDELAALFAEDAVFSIASFGIRREGRNEVLQQIQGMNSQSAKGLHATFNPIIEIAGSKAAGVFDFLWVSFAGRPHIGLGGRYRMSFVWHRDRWLILEMDVEIRSDPAFASS